MVMWKAAPEGGCQSLSSLYRILNPHLGITQKVYCIVVKVVQTEHGRVSSQKGGVGGGVRACRHTELLGPDGGARPSARPSVHTRHQNTELGPHSGILKNLFDYVYLSGGNLRSRNA